MSCNRQECYLQRSFEIPFPTVKYDTHNFDHNAYQKILYIVKGALYKNYAGSAKHSQTPLSLTECLYIDYYVAIKFSYKKLARIAFRVINYVEIEESSVLYFVGDIKCYRCWQNHAAVMAGYYLLKKKQNQCLDIHDIHPYMFLTLIIVICMARSTRPEVFHKKAVLRSFAKLTGKHLCQSLFFNKVASLRPATLLKKRLWHMYFPKRRK